MSLESPTRTERIIERYAGWPMAVRVAIPLVLLTLLIGAVLFGMDRCGTFRSNRAIDKARANVNAALVEVNAAKQVVANDKVDEAVALEKVKQAVSDVVAASNASDETKAAANQAAANYAAVKAANAPTGTSEADLQRRLDELNR